MDFPGKNTGGGLPFPSPGDLSEPGIDPMSSVSSAFYIEGGFFTL